jgi:hypothetical protein
MMKKDRQDDSRETAVSSENARVNEKAEVLAARDI